MAGTPLLGTSRTLKEHSPYKWGCQVILSVPLPVPSDYDIIHSVSQYFSYLLRPDICQELSQTPGLQRCPAHLHTEADRDGDGLSGVWWDGRGRLMAEPQ